MPPALRLTTTLLLIAVAAARAHAQPSDADGAAFFEKRIRPLLADNCYQCHGENKQESGLVLTSFASILKGGDRGNAIVPGDPDQSLLIQAVRYTDDDLKMPPRARLNDEQIADLVAWVKTAAPGAQHESGATVPLPPAPP